MSTRCCCRPSEPCPPSRCSPAPLRRNTNRASPTRAMCLADGDGLGCGWQSRCIRITNVSPRSWASGSKRHLRVACGDETKDQAPSTSTLHCTTLGKKRRAREAVDERPMNASPKLVRYIRRHSCCKIGHSTASSVLCDDLRENLSEGAVKCVARDPWLDTQNAQNYPTDAGREQVERRESARRCLRYRTCTQSSSGAWFGPSSCGTSNLTPLQKAI